MNPGLAVLAVAVVAGGIIAVSSRESRVAVMGLTLAAVTAPLIGDPLPDPLPLAARVVAALLAGYLLWIALRTDPPTRGSRLGWPVEALIAAAAGAAGYGAIRIVTGGGGLGDGSGTGALLELGPREALAAGTALGALALGPVLIGRDVLRLGIGLSLGVLAAQLVRLGLAGPPSALEHVVTAGLSVAISAAVATLAAQAIRSGGGLEVTGSPRAAAGPRAAAKPGASARRAGTGTGAGADDAPLEDPGPDATDRPVTPRSGVGRRSVPGR